MTNLSCALGIQEYYFIVRGCLDILARFYTSTKLQIINPFYACNSLMTTNNESRLKMAITALAKLIPHILNDKAQSWGK